MLDGVIGVHGHDFKVAVTISVWPIRCRYSDVRNQTHKKILLIIDLFEVDSEQQAVEVVEYFIKLFLCVAYDR